MISRKLLIPLILLIIFSFFLTLFFGTLPPSGKVTLSMIPSDIPLETNLVSAVIKTIKERRTVQVELLEYDTCYWIKPTHNGTHYLFQINGYKSTMGKCLGFVENRQYIPREKGLSILGDTCICYGKTYLLEWGKNGIKISKR